MLTLQVVLSGVLLGGLYACMAIGFSIVWGVTNLINLAHGSMIIIGAYITWLLWAQFGVDPFLLVPVAAAALFAFGFVLYRVLLHRVAAASLFMTLILTFGLDRVLVNINLQLFSANVRAITLPYADRVLEIGEIRLPYLRIAVFGVALLLTLLLHLFINHTQVGHSIRATAQNARAASVLGIDTRRVYAVTFGLGAAMAGAAGSLIAMVYSFTPVTGDSLTMKAFVIVVLGGLGSMHGAIIAGIVLGVAENIVSGLIAPGFRDAVSFFLLLAILLTRPRGLFGHRYLADAKMPISVGTAGAASPAVRRVRPTTVLLALAASAVLLAAPAVLGPYWLRVLSNIFMYAVLAQGINLMAGFTGYPAFGNVVFYGLGGYVMAVLMAKFNAPFAVAALAGMAVCPVLALAIGPLLLRLKGHYFAIATLGLNEAVKEIVNNATALTGGGMGLSVPLPPWGPGASAVTFYYLFLGTMVVATWVAFEFSRRRLGIGCGAIRDNEEKAAAVGLHTTRYKTTAWMISATMTGLVGAINAYQMTYIDPPTFFDMAISVKAFVIFLLGGAGTLLGPVAGAFFVELLQTFTWSKLLNWHTGAMGAIIILVVLLAPKGFRDALSRMPTLASCWARVWPRAGTA